MKRHGIYLGLLLIGTALAISGCKKFSGDDSSGQQAQAHIQRAEGYRQQGQYRAAIIEARNAIDAAPKQPDGRIELATLLNDLGQARQALQVLEPIAGSNDKHLILERADAMLLQGKYHSALDYLTPVKAVDDDIRYRIARAEAGLGQIDQARAGFAALQNSARANDAQLQLAKLELQQGNKERGNAILQQILQRDPQQIDALVVLAQQAEAKGQLDQAEELLSRALLNLPQTDILLPQKVSVLRHLMPILTKLGRSNESLVYAKVLADADPEGAVLQARFKQGVEAFQAGKYDEADAALSEVYQQTHDDYAGILLGMVKYSKKDYAGAAAYLGENIDPEITPDAALKALANAEMRLGQPGKLLDLIGPQERERITDPELKALVGIALARAGEGASGERMLTDALRSHPDNAAVRATLAKHYLIVDQPAKAAATLEAGLAQNPDDAGLRRLLVSAYVAAKKPEAALREAQKLAAARPEKAQNYYVLGHTALLIGRHDVSLAALQKALALQPDYAPARLDYAQLQLISKQPQAAEKIYREVLAADPDDINALKGFITTLEMEHGNAIDKAAVETETLQVTSSDAAHAVLAEYYLRHKQRDDAARLLEKINISAGNNYPAYVKQLYALSEAGSLLGANEYARARQVALDGLRLNPHNSSLLILLAHIEIKAGAPTEAAKVIAQLAQVEPNSPALSELRGAVAMSGGDTADAVAQYRQLWNDAKSDQTANKLYQALARTDAPAATQFLAEWHTALPDSDSPLLLRAVQLERAGNTPEAIKNYQAALARNDNNALALNNLALIYSHDGDPRGLTLAAKAYSVKPDNPAILDTYGWLLVKSGQKQRGLELLQRAAQLAPDTKEIIEHLEQAKQGR